jgi:hypothetical protein
MTPVAGLRGSAGGGGAFIGTVVSETVEGWASKADGSEPWRRVDMTKF